MSAVDPSGGDVGPPSSQAQNPSHPHPSTLSTRKPKRRLLSRFVYVLNCCRPADKSAEELEAPRVASEKRVESQPITGEKVVVTEKPGGNERETIAGDGTTTGDEAAGTSEKTMDVDAQGPPRTDVIQQGPLIEQPAPVLKPAEIVVQAPPDGVTHEGPSTQTSSALPTLEVPASSRGDDGKRDELPPTSEVQVIIQAPTPVVPTPEPIPTPIEPPATTTAPDVEMVDAPAVVAPVETASETVIAAPTTEEDVVMASREDLPKEPPPEAEEEEEESVIQQHGLPGPPPLANRMAVTSTNDRGVLPDAPEGAEVPRWLLPPKEARFRDRKCLVLDLDETLVHSSFKVLSQADFTIPVDIEGHIHNVYVIKRPGVDEFMKRVGAMYEVVIFTASVSKYGDPLLDQLDIHNVVHHRLFRESCYNHQGNYVKDLSQIGRELRDTIIIDNSPTSYIFHPQHAVPISSWFSDAHDNELLDLIPVLEDLAGPQVKDVSLVLDVSL
ncbi:MAG: hypothetical protein M1823_004770 [Watsoniomyces obsoletus]|nr:MAG: hypothetical protein M1823_004770 [Watsoniomyces obsoletus]